MSGGFPSSNTSCSYRKPFDSQFNSCHQAADITLPALPSTGIKLNSQESDILVYQATIWGQSKLYLQQRPNSVWARVMGERVPKSASSHTGGWPAWAEQSVASDWLATAIILHLWLYSIHKDHVIDYSILKTKQLMKQHKFLISVALHWSLDSRMFYFCSIVWL